MEVTINRLELTAEVTEEVTPVMNNPKATSELTEHDSDMMNIDATVTESLVGTATDVISYEENNSSMELNTEVLTVEDISADSEDAVSTEQAISTINSEIAYYTVQDGDTLGTIALYYYGDVQFAENIALANNISVDDKIYMDQILIIPNIN